MKKLVTVSLFIFWAISVAILVAAFLSYQNHKGTPLGAATPPAGSQLAAELTQAGGQMTLNIAEVAKHNSVSDCWMVINNKVYDLSSFLNLHPGGVGSMAGDCGREATRAYDTKNIGRPHSAAAQAMLASYYVGDLNQAIGQSQIQQNIQKAQSSPPPAGLQGGEGGEDD